MPYDLVIFRGDPDAPDPIGPAEALAALRGVREAERTLHPAVWRVWQESKAWFVASLDGAGVFTLSASCSHPDLLVNLSRFGLEAVRVAGVLRGRAIEEVGGDVVTAETVAAPFERGGAVYTQLAQTWERTWEAIDREGRAPLDFPVPTADGSIDLAAEYVLFELRGAADVSPRRIRGALTGLVGPHRVREDATGALTVLVPHQDPGLFARLIGRSPVAAEAVKVAVRPDGVVQVTPRWRCGLETFAPIAIEVAKGLGAALGVKVTFHGLDFDVALEQRLRRRFGGSLTDLWMWTRRLATERTTPGRA